MEEENNSVFYTVRVAVRQEKVVLLILEQKVKSSGLNVYSLLFNHKIPGYIFIEVDSEDTALKLISGVKHVKGLINKPISFEEIKNMLEKKEKKVNIEVGDIIEIISGPFKGEKAKVTQVNDLKDMYTVVPIEVAIPIPVNLQGKNIRLLEKHG